MVANCASGTGNAGIVIVQIGRDTASADITIAADAIGRCTLRLRQPRGLVVGMWEALALFSLFICAWAALEIRNEIKGLRRQIAVIVKRMTGDFE